LRGGGFFAAAGVLAAFLITSAVPALGQVIVEVRPGDSLYKIARERLGAESRWREIATANGLQPPYHLRSGDTLVLPGGDTSIVQRDQTTATRSESPVLFRSETSDSTLFLFETTTKSAAEMESETADGFAGGDSLAARSPSSDSSLPPGMQVLDSAQALHRANTADHTPRVSLDLLMAELDVRNPSIAAARAAARAANYRPSQARSLPDPQLRARLASEVDQVGMVDGAGMVSFENMRMYMPMVEASQMIPLGKLEPMGRMEEAMARKMAVEAEKVRVDFLRKLKTAYAELYLVDASSAVLERTRSILNLLVASTEAMYRVGEARQADVLRAQLEVSMIRDRLLMLTGRRRAAAEEVNALLIRPAGSPLAPVAPLLTYDLSPSTSADHGPMVRVAQAELEAADARVDVAQSMFIPDLELMGGIGVESERRPSLSGDPVWEVGVGVTIPIWAGTKQTQGLREAESNRDAARLQVEGERAKARSDWESALAMGRTSRAQVLLYEKTLVPQARLAVDASLSNWRVGSVDFMTVVTNVTTLLGYEIGAIEAAGAFYKSVAMAEESSGASFEWKTTAE
jgi:outer membrane protein TolC